MLSPLATASIYFSCTLMLPKKQTSTLTNHSLKNNGLNICTHQQRQTRFCASAPQLPSSANVYD